MLGHTVREQGRAEETISSPSKPRWPEADRDRQGQIKAAQGRPGHTRTDRTDQGRQEQVMTGHGGPWTDHGQTMVRPWKDKARPGQTKIETHDLHYRRFAAYIVQYMTFAIAFALPTP